MRLAAYLLVFLVAVAAGLAAGTPGMAERAGRRVELRLERALDVDLTYGSVDWDLAGQLTLTDVVARPRSAPPDEHALATADRIVVKADVGWMRARVKLTDVSVEGGRVHLVRRADGTDNVRAAALGLRDLLSPGAGDGGGGGGLSRFIVRHLPEVRASDLEVTVDGRSVALPEALRVPQVVTLSGGTLVAKNGALLKEDDHLAVELRFRETTLDPGQGLTATGTLRLGASSGPFGVAFDRPIRAMLGARVAAVGAITWQDGTLELGDVALSVPAPPEGFPEGEPVDPAVSVRTVRLVLDAGSLAAALRRLTSGDGTPRELLGALTRVELEQPAVVFERRPSGHNFSDLLPKAPEPPVAIAADVGPDKSLGVLMEATRAASRRLAGAATTPPDGDEIRKALVALFARAEKALDRGSERARGVASRLPLRHLVIRGGHFVYREVAAARRPAWDEQLENFDLDVRRSGEDGGDVLEWKATFDVGGTGDTRAGAATANVVDGRLHLGTGDVQVHAAIGRLALHPYRAAIPAAIPVAESTALRDTDVTLVWSPSSRIARATGRVALDDFAVFHPAVATDPMTGIDVDATFTAQLDRERKTLVLSKSTVRLGRVDLTVRADVAGYDEAPKLSGALRLERTRCQDVVDSLPRELIPMLEGLEVTGTLSWQLDVSLDTANVESLVYNTYPELQAFKVLDLGHRLNLGAVQGTFVHRLEEGDGTVREMLVGPGSPTWTPLGQISPYVVLAVTTTEDGSFFRHEGFSTFAIRESIVTNLKRGGFVRGASTISQQLVKNLFLSRSKTISRKLQEMFITWQLENALDKERIMELYLNVIEWGPGLYGITRAAEHYFGKHPAELTALESVFLVSLIPSPKRYYHQFKRGEVTDGWRRHLRWIMGVMVERGKITEAEMLAAAPWSPRFVTAGAPPPTDLDPFDPAPPEPMPFDDTPAPGGDIVLPTPAP